jgi:hypothetical protein
MEKNQIVSHSGLTGNRAQNQRRPHGNDMLDGGHHGDKIDQFRAI